MALKQLLYTSFTVALLAAVWSATSRARTGPQMPLGNSCPRPQYTVRTLSYDPLIQHIENFITPEESQYLLKIAQPRFRRSRAISTDGRSVAAEERTSSTAYLPSDDPVVQCIRSRASEFQGYVDLHMMEDLQVTRYLEGQQYTNHYDWAANPATRNQTTNRETTFFAVLDVDCASCGTRFPKISVDWAVEDERWCDLVDCAAQEELTVRAIAGSAVFWRNLHSDGTGDARTLHAGLPAVGGKKIGLNIWTRREV
ncbi:putative prolyl 4-hydroxylase 4 [Colletotrichum orbiculare MAFF 240422]|uniref:Prolyl 4-hydroxylase 4 n=1 Tax=Colletotrichum orbiculare (strain 104-T / ATCC 96160 / CBS 514.97 / LARS 414 / MAFF 240422) TaxID=1213857 RepID=N4VCW0_COLOR|nr:putative prolyl 4-hydroxylase 4 [Colletotrichum orbiculare MAFF 240422]